MSQFVDSIQFYSLIIVDNQYSLFLTYICISTWDMSSRGVSPDRNITIIKKALKFLWNYPVDLTNAFQFCGFSLILYLANSKPISLSSEFRHATSSWSAGTLPTSSRIGISFCSAFLRIKKANKTLLVSLDFMRSTAICKPRVASPCYFRKRFFRVELEDSRRPGESFLFP